MILQGFSTPIGTKKGAYWDICLVNLGHIQGYIGTNTLLIWDIFRAYWYKYLVENQRNLQTGTKTVLKT